MELSKFKDAETLLNELVLNRPDELTLKLAFASLFKKMGKPNSEIFPIYDQIILVAIKKKENEIIKKFAKNWLESLREEVLLNDSQLVKNRMTDLTPFISDQDTADLAFRTLRDLNLKGLASFREQNLILKPIFNKTGINLDDLQSFEANLFQECELEMSNFISPPKF